VRMVMEILVYFGEVCESLNLYFNNIVCNLIISCITGKKIPHDPFTDGKEQIIMFGNCS